MKEKRKVVLLAGFVLYSFYLIAQEEMGKVEVRQGIPEFSVIDEYGNKLTIGPYLEKVILIHFFTIRNENTSRELEEIKNDIWEKYKDYTNFALMVIGVENRDDELSGYKKKEDIPFYLYSDPVGEIYAHFALGETLPHTYLVDINNKVVHILNGYSPGRFADLEILLRNLLHATPVYDDPRQTEESNFVPVLPFR